MNNTAPIGTTAPAVFGIGNPLIDVVIQAQDSDLAELVVDKGIMHLVDEERQQEILTHFGDAPRTYRPGGAAPNTLLALAGLGVPAAVCGKIGNDEFGQTYNEQVAAYGITSRLIMGNGATGSSVILVTPDGERTMNTHLGMCREFGAADLDEDLLRKSRYLYFTGYMWDTEVQKAGIRRAIDVARDAGVLVAFDLADPFAVERYRTDFLDLLRDDVDIVFANGTEAQILYGTNDAEEAARALGEHVRVAALKVGKEGSIVVQHEASTRAIRLTSVPGRPLNVIDTTGAGDMFAAGFLAALATERDVVSAARAAGWLAEAVIQQIGAQFTVEKIRELRAEMDTAIQAE
ncbi:MAG: adenosine kinase [Spirochaeta sp.]|jgi:sugar/nucleoside kinase (ribokinase family)|nr:adenosine kinase [Spirochaeta sp.]